MRTLVLGGVVLIVAIAVLRARRGKKRVRTPVHQSPRATERWEDEGGALRGRPA